MSTRRSSFTAGVLAASVMLPGVATFGMIVGVTAVNAGLSVGQAMAMSLTIFAGASQLAVVQLLNDGAVPAVILLTALFINLRLVMYSASLAPRFQHLNRRWRLQLAYFLVDQNYAMSIDRYQRGMDDHGRQLHWYFLGAGVALWCTWQVSTLMGIYMGAGIPREWSLEFVFPLVFLVLLMPMIHNRAHIAAALTAGVVATVAQPMPLNMGLVTGALSGVAAGLLFARMAR